MAIAKSVFTGVDYVRITAADHGPLAHWENLLQPNWEVEAQLGRKQHYRWVLGYWGRVTEHTFVGKNDSGCMVQISGSDAWEHWEEAARYSRKCTRMDLQVTWPLDGEPGEYIRDMYEIGQLAPKREGKQHELQITDTPRGAKMLTAGVRKSEIYGRMYDKFRESKMPEYKNCVRWEIEVKGDQAIDLCGYLLDNRCGAPEMRAIVHQFWKVRGMTPFWDTYEGMEARPPIKRTRNDDTKLAWLKTQIAPAVRGLRDRGRFSEAIQAIFGGELTREQVEGIMLLLEENGDS